MGAETILDGGWRPQRWWWLWRDEPRRIWRGAMDRGTSVLQRDGGEGDRMALQRRRASMAAEAEGDVRGQRR
jgi:hypothetical protein